MKRSCASAAPTHNSFQASNTAGDSASRSAIRRHEVWRTDAPDALLAQPTPEHLAPVFVALGAQAPGDQVETVFEGIRHGNLSMRTFALRPAGDPAAPHRSTP